MNPVKFTKKDVKDVNILGQKTFYHGNYCDQRGYVEIYFGDGMKHTYYFTNDIKQAVRDGAILNVEVKHPNHGNVAIIKAKSKLGK